MRELGHFHSLSVLEIGEYAAILDGGEWGRLSLSLKQCPRGLKPGAELNVFIYLDAEGNPAPTTQRPAALVGQVAWLKISEVNNLGAFAAWGIPKDLFIPFAEQQHTLNKGSHALVRVYQDNQGRLAGSTYVDRWIKDYPKNLKAKQKVSLVIADKTELGFKAVINHEYWGLLYSNELYRRIRKGQSMDGYVNRVRPDGKVDLTLNQPGFSADKLDGVSAAIVAALEENGGFLALNDKSPPPEIYAAFGVSKKVFKQAVGALYKKRLISLETTGIQLL